MLVGAIPFCAQRAASIPGAVRLDVASPAAGATWRIWPDLFEDLDLVAAAQKLQPAG